MKAVSFHRTYPARPQAIAHARADLVRFLADQACSEVEIAEISLACCEGATNCVLHAYRGVEPGSFHIEADATPDGLLVEVRDDGIGMTPNPESPGLGLGLALMAALCEEFSAVGHGPGTVVRMRFPPPAALAGAAAWV
jgi:anti-sigma regulatory factor (Ser/Thr protein kinase)